MDIEHVDYGNELILLVDDEEANREMIELILKRIGFEVYSVGSGNDALEELRQKPYTFLLTDIRMEGMDGLELISKSIDNYPDICAIAMTGHLVDYNYMDVVNAGATDFINKPFKIVELEAKLKRAIIERNTKKQLSILSVTDSLTDIYNQGHFFVRLKKEIKRAERQKYKLALIMFDIDGFKSYNDEKGHLAGDDILRKVGAIIKESIRQGVDSGYRYGGDEFTIILIDAEKDIVLGIGTRIQKSIKDTCNLTVSMGFSNFSKGMSLEELVNKADTELYKVKNLKKRKVPDN